MIIGAKGPFKYKWGAGGTPVGIFIRPRPSCG